MESWDEYKEWHKLLDGLCNACGFDDNADLASVFCARSGRGSQADFDAARKKLRSWRTGKRLPRYGNLMVLFSILEVDRHPGLQERWNNLYRAASAPSRHRGRAPPQRRVPRLSAGYPHGVGRWAAICALPFLGIGLAAVVNSDNQLMPIELPEVGYNAYVQLQVGDSRLIHGEYDRCDSPPPDWEQVRTKVPSTMLGIFTDGGLARKMVNDCGREMVVRAVMFTGLTSGVEELRLLDDFMKIEVRDHRPES